MPEYWSLPRIVHRVHRLVLEPLGFEREGNSCVRRDALLRSIRFYAARSSVPRAQILLQVALPGLPDATCEFRRDALWAPLEPASGPNHYPRPRSADPAPTELVDDVAGPGLEFLLRAPDLPGFVTWAEEIHAGDGHPNCWRRFRPVLPQGTAALQAAAFAAALAGDHHTCRRLASRVVAEESGRRERRDFVTELNRIAPDALTGSEPAIA